jgi:hypothetical protein
MLAILIVKIAHRLVYIGIVSPSYVPYQIRIRATNHNDVVVYALSVGSLDSDINLPQAKHLESGFFVMT